MVFKWQKLCGLKKQVVLTGKSTKNGYNSLSILILNYILTLNNDFLLVLGMKKIVFFIFLLGAVVAGYILYPKVMLYLAGNKSVELTIDKNFYVKSGATLDELLNQLKEDAVVSKTEDFKTYGLARNLKESTIRSGKYRFKKSDTWKDVVNKLRMGNGEQEVSITFNNARTLEEIAKKITKNLEVTEVDFLARIGSKEVQNKYGFNEHTIRSIFIPNTYSLFWDTDADALIARMAKEYKAFWTPERKQKAKAIGLSQSEVSTLASIVKTETAKNEDIPIIAGVYMNRLRIGMPLQADPTLIFSIGDFSIKRVLNVDKKIDSPYNTYMYKGLPPGPIYVSPVKYIDGVLNYDKNDYLYFCASENLDGSSNFAKNLSEHNVNARKYQQALNKRKLYR